VEAGKNYRNWERRVRGGGTEDTVAAGHWGGDRELLKRKGPKKDQRKKERKRRERALVQQRHKNVRGVTKVQSKTLKKEPTPRRKVDREGKKENGEKKSNRYIKKKKKFVTRTELARIGASQPGCKRAQKQARGCNLKTSRRCKEKIEGGRHGLLINNLRGALTN